MKIYIDDEEVLCASNLVIKEQLKNTSSVILNNVYPKTWETDKDYTKFYMPEEYSQCTIKEDIPSTSEYDLLDNLYTIEKRSIAFAESQINYWEGYNIQFLRVVPGKTYKITIDKLASAGWRLYEGDNTNIHTTLDILFTVTTGIHDYTVTPTKRYLIYVSKTPTETVMSMTSAKVQVEDILFSGYIKNSGNINLNPRYPHYATLQALDYKGLLSEGDMLNYVIENETVLEIIRNLIKDKNGFYLGEFKASNDLINLYNCNNKTVYDVLDYLAEITGSIWYTKTIDPDITLIYFTSIENIVQKDNIEYTQSYFEENKVVDLKYSYNSKDYRNKQSIVNENAISQVAQTEYITYIGEDINTLYPIGKINYIRIGEINRSVATMVAKNNGTYAAFYYEPESTKIEVNMAVSGNVVIQVSYYPILTSRQVAYNQTEIERISNSTKRDGIISRYEKRTDTNNNEELNQIAQSYLEYKGVPQIILDFKTQVDILEIGDKVYFNGPLDSLKTDYLVTEKTVDMTVTGNQQVIFYSYRLSSSFNDENAINYFDNQRRKTDKPLKEGEYISRYIDIPSNTNIVFYDLQVIEISQPTNALDSELEVEL